MIKGIDSEKKKREKKDKIANANMMGAMSSKLMYMPVDIKKRAEMKKSQKDGLKAKQRT